jgi:sugar/nucleoside kinase (ribokinase family)
MSYRYDVAGLGNAIVDVIARTDDAFLARHGLAKGAMTLISAETADRLYADMGPAIEVSGGSAANTMAGIASLGGRAAYMGRVFADQLGQVFRHDIRAAGVAFDTGAANSGPPTARCLVLVTPDAQRTMQTYLGACVDFGPDDIAAGVVEASRIVYLEGYLWDKPQAKEAFRKAVRVAHANGNKVALTLSDAFCVDRHRAEFRALIEDGIDIVLANEAEIVSLWQVGAIEDAIAACQKHADRVWAVTRSEKGSVVIGGGACAHVPAEKITRLVDTTGAGDLYAAGFLYGLSQDRPLAECARLGHVCASEVISHYGARPEISLKVLAAARMK